MTPFHLLLLLILLAGQSLLSPAAEPQVYGERLQAHWFEDGAKFWYEIERAGGKRDFVIVNSADGSKSPAFDPQRLATAISEKSGSEISADELDLEALEISDNAQFIHLKAAEKNWKIDRETYAIEEEKIAQEETRNNDREDRWRERRGRNRSSSTSPDGRWDVRVRGHNLYLRDTKNDEERQLTFDGNPAHTYARDARRDRFVEMRYDARDEETPTPDIYWSPDSKHFVAMRLRPGMERMVYMVASSPDDQLQPTLESYPYLKPGDEIPIRKPHLFVAESGQHIALDDALFPNPWSISEPRWASDSSHFTFMYNQRGHQALRLIKVAVADPQPRAIINEESETFIDYAHKQFIEYLDESGELIWMSERDGWNHLYLYDAETGKVKNQVTQGEWVVRGVDRVDPKTRQIWFRAGGIRPGQDPYYIHYARVNFDGTGLVIQTEGDGNHSAQFSPKHQWFVDTWSRVNQPPVHELRAAGDGRLIGTLEEADARELLASGWIAPEPFVAKGRDGETDIFGVIHRPANFDASRIYPVIESIYAGPHGAFVPKGFRARYGHADLAEKGFIIVQIDGMGTSYRSKKFHNVAWKNIGDSGFPDRILWMKAAAEKYPYLDLTRVGIYGGSAGGQSALRALLAHGDFYKAAASDCGCHDNRMDKIWWNELWMGWPVGPHYDEQSNVTQAHKLQGKLLLTVGELDRNVDPASTMQVVNALIKADKDFELIVFPGAGHGAGGSPYGRRRRTEFFVRHLLEPAPVGVSASEKLTVK